MAQGFKLDDTTINHITQANWIDKPVAQALDGETPLAHSRTHTWASEAMPESIFDLVSAFEGQPVRLTTTNYSDPNNSAYIEYPGAVLISLTANHPGPLISGVMATFLVRV